MSRKSARETAMKLVYEWSVIGEQEQENDTTLTDIAAGVPLDERDYAYIQNVLKGIKTHTVPIDETIEKHAIGWKLARIAKVDLAILRVALYEILYCDTIPPSVSINEAVELAKRYGSDDSPSFINGLLGMCLRHMAVEEENR